MQDSAFCKRPLAEAFVSRRTTFILYRIINKLLDINLLETPGVGQSSGNRRNELTSLHITSCYLLVISQVPEIYVILSDVRFNHFALLQAIRHSGS